MQNQPTYNTMPNPNPTPTSVPPVPPVAPQGYAYASAPTAQPAQANPYQPATSITPLAVPTSTDTSSKKSHRSLVETIVLVLVSLIAVTFIGLFIWKYLEWDNVKTDVDGQIDAAVAIAVSENTTKLENEFLEREKYPYKTFSGPADYGSLNFEFPKTWDTYIAKDAASGGTFEAYLNPGEVLPVGSQTINALRVQILNQAFENVVPTYNELARVGRVSITTRPVGSIVANVYAGNLPNGIRGIVTIFKLRDKTVLLQTDAELFAEEYYKLLDTVTFVE